MEPRWHHSLTYPLVQVPIFFRLALLLTFLTALALAGWLSIDRYGPTTAWASGLLGVSLFLLSLALGRTLNYFSAILALAAQGKVKHEPGMEFDPVRALIGCGQWLLCFLAGPALLFGAALGYWTYSGDLTLVDWTILAELGFAGVGWWLMSLLLTNAKPTIRVPTPWQVVRLAYRMGWNAAELTLLASAVLLVHFSAAVWGIGHLHDNVFVCFPLLCLCATTGLYLAAFVFRRLGLTYHRLERTSGSAHTGDARQPRPLDSLAPPGPPVLHSADL